MYTKEILQNFVNPSKYIEFLKKSDKNLSFGI